MAVFGSGRGLSRLTQQPSQETVAFGASAGMVLSGALTGTGADTQPGRQLRSGRKGNCGGTDLGENLLRSFRADARNLNEAGDRILPRQHLRRRQLIQFLDLT